MSRYKETPLIFELATSNEGSRYIRPLDVPKPDFSEWFGDAYREGKPNIPDVDEISVVRHFTNLSSKNYHVEVGTYPLGSCTMKYNPKVNEDMSALTGFAATHPMQPDETVQAHLELLYHLEKMLNDGPVWPPIRSTRGRRSRRTCRYPPDQGVPRRSRRHGKRDTIIVPDAAHGTNPATAAMAGYKVREVKSNEYGTVDLESLKRRSVMTSPD